jgi:hypothetical protein
MACAAVGNAVGKVPHFNEVIRIECLRGRPDLGPIGH